MATLSSAISNAITQQNTRADNQYFPGGVPTDYSWYAGSDTAYGNKPPSNFTAVTGWGQIYPEAGAAASANTGAQVQIANFTTYALLSSGQWVEVQGQSKDQIAGAHYVADFSGNSSVPWKETVNGDGSVTTDAPPSGYNDHFWPSARGTYAAGSVVGIFVEANMKTTDPNAQLVANLGADWWASSNAQYVNGFANNPGVGSSNWVKLTTQYQTLYFSSLSAQQLLADPPPTLATGSSTTTTSSPPPLPEVTSVLESPATGTLAAGQVATITLKLNEAVTVKNGTPTLTLNDGGTATYTGGSGTNALAFSYKVAAGQAASSLAATGVSLNGATIADTSGNNTSLSLAGLTQSGPKVAGGTTTSDPTGPTSSNPTGPTSSDPPPTSHPHGAWHGLWQQYLAAGIGFDNGAGQLGSGHGHAHPAHEGFLGNPHHH